MCILMIRNTTHHTFRSQSVLSCPINLLLTEIFVKIRRQIFKLARFYTERDAQSEPMA